MEEWIALVQKSGPPTEKERREWLKKEYKLGTNTACGGYEKKDRITRRIEIKSKADIDDELKSWLETAYELDK